MPTPVKTIRRETRLVEGICEHGIGHPLYASADWMSRYTPGSSRESWMIHGCDGCCQDHEWQIATLQDSVELANTIIIAHKEWIEDHDVPTHTVGPPKQRTKINIRTTDRASVRAWVETVNQYLDDQRAKGTSMLPVARFEIIEEGD